jgi:Protein of unknown function (DUF3027)
MTQPTTAPRRPRTARPRLDAVAADAVELAREALLEVTEPGQVGEHLRVEASGERLVTHVFECTMPGYRGWSWVVVLTRAARAKAATVAETALLPGDEAILAPEWEPWSERLKPEDVGADDLLPFREQDIRLEQGYEATGDEDEDRVAQWELGLGRARVLSPEGRGEAAERWLEGEFGPRQTSDRGRRGTVSANCSSCGFLSLLSGSLRGEFGVCTNEWSPADGKVVHLGYGCGAHSETGQEEDDREFARPGAVVVDELDVEFQQHAEDEAPAEAEVTDAEATGTATSTEAEPAALEPAAAKPTEAEQKNSESEVPEADSAADDAAPGATDASEGPEIPEAPAELAVSEPAGEPEISEAPEADSVADRTANDQGTDGRSTEDQDTSPEA